MAVSLTRFFALGIFLLSSTCFAQPRAGDSPHLIAGFRASRVLNSYPNHIFPNADYWISAGNRMSKKFSGASPAGVWIVSLYQDNNITQFNFPSDGNSYPYIQFISSDENEAYLSRFDSLGFNIWLQVEPGAAGMDTLIDLVLNRYKHHRCVKGFGIDVEWYFAATSSGGLKVTDSSAQRWEQKVRSVDSSYTLFLKHYAPSWMPPAYRGNILFVDDSQEFSSGLSQMVSEFKSWGSKFSPNDVAFQFGYPKDSTWWRLYADPPKTIGDALLSNIPNTYALFWVDFTIIRVFPVLHAGELEAQEILPAEFSIEQNFPNPFNPTTVISYELKVKSFVTMSVFDLLGNEVASLVNKQLSAGSYEAEWDAGNFPSGVYYCRLRVDNMAKVIKLVLLK